GFQEGQEQDLAVGAAGFQGDGRDPAEAPPGDELAQSGRVGRERAHRVGAIGGGLDTDPVAGIADIDTGGVLVVHRQAGELGTCFGVTARLGGAAGRPPPGRRGGGGGGRGGGGGGGRGGAAGGGGVACGGGGVWCGGRA